MIRVVIDHYPLSRHGFVSIAQSLLFVVVDAALLPCCPTSLMRRRRRMKHLPQAQVEQ
jgi:hypothetical protein